MADLADASTEDLKAEIRKLQAMVDRRKEEAKREAKPKPLVTPDFSVVIKLCQDYINDLESTGNADENYDSWMFETAMCAVFGNSVWEWTNPILRGEDEKWLKRNCSSD